MCRRAEVPQGHGLPIRTVHRRGLLVVDLQFRRLFLHRLHDESEPGPNLRALRPVLPAVLVPPRAALPRARRYLWRQHTRRRHGASDSGRSGVGVRLPLIADCSPAGVLSAGLSGGGSKPLAPHSTKPVLLLTQASRLSTRGSGASGQQDLPGLSMACWAGAEPR